MATGTAAVGLVIREVGVGFRAFGGNFVSLLESSHSLGTGCVASSQHQILSLVINIPRNSHGAGRCRAPPSGALACAPPVIGMTRADYTLSLHC
ncbi:hypothetical protein EVAR_31296_1 [Eumeta japonica]|uniref:Uncharacterized protein n=1 Tax=Eumeta variegata TaxID=151549 RepID=A0A4C1VR78_EUMVA|nr:hypothetical protein EVAR_31296_1 [Eumeta japonica]